MDFIDNNIIIKEFLGTVLLKYDHKKIHTHRRKCYALFFRIEGEAQYTFEDGTTICNRKNDIIFLPKWSTFDTNITQEGKVILIDFQIVGDPDLKPFNISIKNPLVLDLFYKTKNLWERKASYYNYSCMAYTYQVLDLIAKEYKKDYLQSGQLQTLKPAIDYIHNNYLHEQICIPDLAKLCNLGETYFRKIFLKSYSTSPIKYINSLRFEHAQKLIESELYSISEVSKLSGFFDDSYFSREFKKRYGVSPSKWLRNKTSN